MSLPTIWTCRHIEWLKRYLQEYENAFILISHDIPFLNSVINIIYHMENQRLDRYVGDYDKFQEVYEVKKSQLEVTYKKQRAGDFPASRISLPETRPGWRPEIWRCRARKSWTRWT